METGFGRSDLTAAPRGRYDRFSPDLWRCINGIRDHVYPELLLPDFALFWSYRQKRKRGGGLGSGALELTSEASKLTSELGVGC